MSQSWVSKNVKESKDYSYLAEMMSSVLSLKEKEIEIEPVNIPTDLKQNIAKAPKPPKEELTRKHRSRFLTP